MGFLNSGGQAANSFADNFMKAYQITGHNRLEQDKLAEQKMLQDTIIAEHRDKLKRQQDLDRELQALYAPQPVMGMMSDGGPTIPQGQFVPNPSLDIPRNTGQMAPGNPSLEQYLGVLQKYKPEQALTARVSLQNTDERLKAQREIQDVRNKAQLDLLAQKQDQALKLFDMTSDVKFKQAADKAASDMALLMERLQGMKDVQGMKNTGKKSPTLKFQNDYTKAASKKEELVSQMDDINDHADRLLGTQLGRITGISGAIPNIPGTKAADSQAALDSFKSKLGLTTLAALKSGTGAGLGQVTEAEHKLLQNFISELDNAQSEKALRESIGRIQKWAEGAKGRIVGGYEKSIYGKYDREQNGETTALPTSGGTIKYDANGNRVK